MRKINTFLCLIIMALTTSAKVSTFPYQESFESGTGIWVQSADDDRNWDQRNSYTSSNETGPYGASDSTYYYYTEASGSNNNEFFLDGTFDLSSTTSPVFSFDYHMYGIAMGTLSIEVLTATDTNTLFKLTGQQQNSISEAWRRASIDLSAYEGIDSVVIRFNAKTGNSYRSDISIDNISLTTDNTIPVIKNQISDIQVKEGFGIYKIDLSDLFYDADGDTLYYNAASSNTSLASVSIANDTLNINEVSNGFSDIIITATDSNGGYTMQIFSFTILSNSSYNTPTITSTRYLNIRNIEVFDFNNSTGDGGYSDYTDSIIEMVKNGSYTISINRNSDRAIDNYANFWIDWNQDYDFDDPGEKYTTPKSIGNIISSSIVTVPVDAKLGHTRLRIRTAFENIDPYSNVTFGEIEDYTINVVADTNNKPFVNLPIGNITNTTGFTADTIILKDVFGDADGDSLIYSISSSDNSVVTTSIKNDTIFINEEGEGISIITISANDYPYSSISHSFSYAVNNSGTNNAPTLLKGITDLSRKKHFSSSLIYLDSYFGDADGDTLEFSASSSNISVAEVVIDSNILSINEVSSGSTEILIIATDTKGGYISERFMFTVKNEVPIVSSSLGNRTFESGFGSTIINISNLFSDADNDQLSYSVNNSNGTFVTATLIGNDLIINEIGVGQSNITITANDNDGGIANYNFNISVTTPGNTAPVIENTLNDLAYNEGFGSKKIYIGNVFSDADGDIMIYEVSSDNKTAVEVSLQQDSIVINEVGYGNSKISLTANDNNGGIVTHDFIVNVNKEGNNIPTVNNPIDDKVFKPGFKSKSIDLNDLFTDSDGDFLSLSVSTNNSIFSMNLSNNTLIIDEINNDIIGYSRVTITADDGKGGTASYKFTITIEDPSITDPVSDIDNKDSEPIIYPNPVKSEATVSFNDSYIGSVSISVVGIHGNSVRIIKTIKEGNEFEVAIPTSELKPGVYYIQIIEGNNSHVSRILKQ